MKIIIANSKEWFKPSKSILFKNEILSIKKNNQFNIEKIRQFGPELIFFPHWNWIVPEEVHKEFNCIIFHTAPLPYGRGGSPIQNLILNGFKESPVCALKMESKFDSGPIYLKKIINLEGSLSEIFNNLNLIINQMMEELIDYLPIPKEQEGDIVIFKRLQEKDNLIPKNISLKKTYDRIRMLDDNSYPNPFLNYGNLKIQFYEAKLMNGEIYCKAKIITKNHEK